MRTQPYDLLGTTSPHPHVQATTPRRRHPSTILLQRRLRLDDPAKRPLPRHARLPPNVRPAHRLPLDEPKTRQPPHLLDHALPVPTPLPPSPLPRSPTNQPPHPRPHGPLRLQSHLPVPFLPLARHHPRQFVALEKSPRHAQRRGCVVC